MMTKLAFHGEILRRTRPLSSTRNFGLCGVGLVADISAMPSLLAIRVRERLDALGIKASEAQSRGGLQRNFISDIFADKKRTVKGPNGFKLAAALETSLAYLVGETDDPGQGPELLVSEQERDMITAPEVGVVEAGAFREVDPMDQRPRRPLYVERDRDFPKARMMVFTVAGDSMDALSPIPILPGMKVVCIDYDDVADRLPIRDGMVVVVERSRDAGMMREWSVKQIEFFGDRIEFHPRSKNARHKPIIVPRDAFADEGSEVKLLGVVRRIQGDVALS